jgi:hypothetical protein
MPRYDRVKDGSWVQPVDKGYKMACCDCGSVHEINFRIINIKTGRPVKGFKVQFQAFRHNRATAAVRRKPHAYIKKED